MCDPAEEVALMMKLKTLKPAYKPSSVLSAVVCDHLRPEGRNVTTGIWAATATRWGTPAWSSLTS